MTTYAELTVNRRRHSVGHTVLVSSDQGMIEVPVRRRDRVLAWLRSDALDRRLAAGVAPETSPALAVRAATIAAPAARATLAQHWENLIVRAAEGRAVIDARVPVRREAVLAARADIEALAAVLRSAPFVPVRAVALAGQLLTSADSPVYRVRRGDLREVLARLLESSEQPA